MTSHNKQADRNHICIGLITRGRPQMLGTCLASLSTIDVPTDVARVTFIIVENNDRFTIGPQIKKFENRTPHQVVSLNEARLGIPIARNKVLDTALDIEADFLAFLDDDETARKDWLVNLWQTHRDNNHDLTGGPVAIAPLEGKSTWAQRMVFRGLVARANRIARRAQVRAAHGDESKTTVITSNWLLRLSTQRQSGLRFDESLKKSGGSDSVFFHHARAANYKTGWAAEAYVDETMPLSRLSFRYQFKRGSDQTLVSSRQKYRNRHLIRVFPEAIGFCVSKFIVAVLRTLAAPTNDGASLVLAVRAMGAAHGRVLALWKPATEHYAHVHGS